MHMTPQQLAKYQAAIAAGHTISAALAAAGVVVTAEQLTEMEASATAFKAEQEAAAKVATDAAAIEAAKVAAAASTGVAESANDLLKSQLVTANASLLAANVELVNLKASTQSMTANHDGLLAIARSAVAAMSVPMGGSSASADAMDAAKVIAEHARIKPLYLEKFKVGQQSLAADADAGKKDAVALPLDFQMRAQQSK